MTVELRWHPRPQPLDPVAVVATGPALPALARATAAAITTGVPLRAARGDGWLLVLAEDARSLPWADGVTYLGREDGLLLPTTLAPDPHAAALRMLLPNAPLRAALPGHVLLADTPARTADPDLVS